MIHIPRLHVSSEVQFYSCAWANHPTPTAAPSSGTSKPPRNLLRPTPRCSDLISTRQRAREDPCWRGARVPHRVRAGSMDAGCTLYPTIRPEMFTRDQGISSAAFDASSASRTVVALDKSPVRFPVICEDLSLSRSPPLPYSSYAAARSTAPPIPRPGRAFPWGRHPGHRGRHGGWTKGCPG